MTSYIEYHESDNQQNDLSFSTKNNVVFTVYISIISCIIRNEKGHRLIHMLLIIDFRCIYKELCTSRTYVSIYLMVSVIKLL